MKMGKFASHRIRRTEELRQTQEDALNSTIFILKQFGPTSFLLQDESRKKYRVHIGQEHTCTCSEFKSRQELCIHICWVMLKRFKIDQNNSITWQLGLVEREVQDMLDGKHSRTVTSTSMQKKPEDARENEEEMKQRPIGPDDICAICQDELLTEKRHPVTYCRNGCGNSVHIRCMRVWTDHLRKQKSMNLSESVPCPICREDFGQIGMLLREITENIHPREAKAVGRKPTVVAPMVQTVQSSMKVCHSSDVCMSCGATPIYGNVYRCQLCEEKLDLMKSTFMCATCFRQGKHPEHDRFMYRETPNGKWLSVGTNRCIPHNLSHTLKGKSGIFVEDDDILLSPRRVIFSDQTETLRLKDLARLPHWTISQPRNRSVRKTARQKMPNVQGDFVSQVIETAKLGRSDGSHARLDNWGSIMTTGLLAPGRQCRICLMSFRMGDVVRRLVPGCEHIFHTTCIDPWLLHQSATCPLDGSRVIPTNVASNSVTKTLNPSANRFVGEIENHANRFSELKVNASAFHIRPFRGKSTTSDGIPLDSNSTNSQHTNALNGFTVVGQSAASSLTRSARSSDTTASRNF